MMIKWTQNPSIFEDDPQIVKQMGELLRENCHCDDAENFVFSFQWLPFFLLDKQIVMCRAYLKPDFFFMETKGIFFS